MAKVDAIDAILESATKAIAESGFEGASLRQIAAQAGVSLSMIDAYFGSKEQLFRAVVAAAWDDLARGVDASLQQAALRNATGTLSLEELWMAIALPVVRRARSADEHTKRRFQVFARGREYLAGHGDEPQKIVNPALLRWVNLMALACPTLSLMEVAWAFSYCIGVCVSFQVVDRYYEKLIGVDDLRGEDAIAADIAAFCCAGVRALVDKSAQQAAAPPSG